MAKSKAASDKKLGDELKRLRSQIALVLKDEELLDRLFKRLRPQIAFFAWVYTKTHADGDLGVASEATDSAMEKVFEYVAQLDSESAKHILDADTYLLKIAHNDVIDHFRVRREITLGHQTAPMATIDGGQAGEAPDVEDIEAGGRGYRIFLLPGEKRDKARRNVASTNPFMERLMEHFCTPIDFGEGQDGQRSHLRPSRLAKLARLLVDTMPSEVARLVVGEYLLGYRPVNIAKQWGIQKSNISRTLKTWRYNWGLDENREKEIRQGFLLHGLADISREATYERNKAYPQWSKRAKGTLGIITRRNDYLQRLYSKVTTDHRTAAWLGGPRKDNLLADPELSDQVLELERFVGRLCVAGWGWDYKTDPFLSPDEEDYNLDFNVDAYEYIADSHLHPNFLVRIHELW